MLFRSELHDVPGHTVLTPAEAIASDQARARGLLQQIDGERHLPFPLRVDGEPGGRLRTLMPEPGADRRDVLASLGFSTDDIARLIATGALDPSARQTTRAP